MCVFLVCVLVLFRASVCTFRVSELLVVRLSFVVKLFILLRSLRSEFWFSCRVLNSSFRVEFWIRILSSILEFDFSNSRSRILKSNFEFDFFVSLLNSISRISIFDSNFEFKFLDFSCRICRRNFRCLALFDFSNFNFRFEFRIQVPWIFESNLSSKFLVETFDVLLYSTSRISLLYSTSRFKCLEFQIRLSRRLDLFDFSNFDLRRQFRV